MDCAGAATFQITGPGSAGDAISGTVVHNSGAFTPGPGNATKDLGKIFEGDAKIAKFYAAQYYIANNANGQPALYRATTTATQELVEGIEDLQILYGVDSDSGDKIPDIFKKATDMVAADWNRVVAVRFGILARTLANTNNTDKAFGTDPDTTVYDVDGDNKDNFTAPGDFYQRRIFRATVVLRNMQ
jgi:type IV pilus assembly protein PilW